MTKIVFILNNRNWGYILKSLIDKKEKQTKMKDLPLLIGLFLLCLSGTVQAQYTGGNGKGDVMAGILAFSLNGQSISFPGSIGRGDAVAGNESLSLNGLTIAFPGGIGRGDAMAGNESLSLNGITISFRGGIGRGDAVGSNLNISLNGLAITYSGGIGRGDAVGGNLNISLNGLAITYSGGIGRGDAVGGNANISLNGLAITYSGGIGRGDISDGLKASYLNGNMPFSVGLFIQGFYTGSSLMTPVLFNNGLNISNTACDSITVELHDSQNPSFVILTQKTLLRTNGLSVIAVPPGLLGSSCYIVVKHRNALETWSKTPVTIASNQIFDFRYP